MNQERQNECQYEVTSYLYDVTSKRPLFNGFYRIVGEQQLQATLLEAFGVVARCVGVVEVEPANTRHYRGTRIYYQLVEGELLPFDIDCPWYRPGKRSMVTEEPELCPLPHKPDEIPAMFSHRRGQWFQLREHEYLLLEDASNYKVPVTLPQRIHVFVDRSPATHGPWDNFGQEYVRKVERYLSKQENTQR